MNKEKTSQSNAVLTGEQKRLLLEAHHELIFWWAYPGTRTILLRNLAKLFDLGYIQEMSYNTWGITTAGQFYLASQELIDDPVISKLFETLLITPTCDICGECLPDVVTLPNGFSVCLDCADDDYSGAMICRAVRS